MIRKKDSFLTFLFSLVPGAGQMYMGFMKRGVSLMSVFFFLIFLSSWLSIGTIMFILPIVWFYSFFDVFNLRSIPDDEFYAQEDDFIILPEFSRSKLNLLHDKYNNIIAVILIVIGFSILWNNLYGLFRRLLPYYIYEVIYTFGHYFPQLLVGIAIIYFGFYLIRGKKKELDRKEEIGLLEDKGGER